MATISVRVLDGMCGRPAPGVLLRLEVSDFPRWRPLVSGMTVDDGRLATMDAHEATPGAHRLTIDASGYFAGLGALAPYRDFAVGIYVREAEADPRLVVYLSTGGFAIYWDLT